MPEKPPISVLFHRPGSPALERLIPSEHGETCFRMHPWVRADQHKPIEIRGRIEIGASVFGDQRPIIKPNAHALRGSERHAHMDLVALGKAHIASGKMEKVVLSSQLTVGIATLDPEEVVRRQAQAHPDSFSWMVQHPDIGMWFGSSPEPLIEGEWPRFRTACLAGTRMSHTGAQSDPWTTKEIQEQQFVVDAVLASLQKSECEAVDIGQRETVQYGPIEHLRTIVNFRQRAQHPM